METLKIAYGAGYRAGYIGLERNGWPRSFTLSTLAWRLGRIEGARNGRLASRRK